MSARALATVRNAGAYPENGPTTKTFENCDVVNGNKVPIEPNLIGILFNSSGTSKTVTYTYDDDHGVSRTDAVSLAAGEVAPVQIAPRLGRHAADAAEHGFAWFTASGSAGEVKQMWFRAANPLL